jgi:putative glycosyltransferase (TIGR04372 family)
VKKIINFLNTSNFFPYYIITPLPYAIGTASIDILFGINKARIKKKKLIIIAPSIAKFFLKYSICNNYLFNNLIIDGYSQKDFFITKKIFSLFINLNFFINRSIALIFFILLKIKFNETFNFLRIGLLDSYYDTDKKKKEENENNTANKIKPYDFFFTKNAIALDSVVESQSQKIIKKIGIQEGQDFVCLHVREGVYRNDANRRPYRNSNIENYYELIKFLISKNIFIIRMGRKSEQPLALKNKFIYDLPFSEFKYDFFDLYLMKKCKFFIGDQSGLTDLAILLSKDCLKTNMLRIFELLPTTIKSRSICKIPFYKKNKKSLRLKEYLDLPYLYHHSKFINEELDFMENSSEDLYLSAKEYYKLIYTNSENNSVILLTEIQKKFNKMLLERFSEMYFKKDEHLKNFFRPYCFFRWVKSIRGGYSSCFLEKYL